MSVTLTQNRTFLTVGPPGTGKTTYVVRQCESAVSRWCEKTREAPQLCRDVLITTLTRAAASELRSRGLEIAPYQIGTLHSHAYRSLSFPKLCVNKSQADEFNEWCDNPHFHISACGESRGDPGERKHTRHGDYLREQYFFHRARRTPRHVWPEQLTIFADKYETWKTLSNYLDFADCIDDAYDTVDCAPGNPSVIFVDEAQDHDRSELRLIRKWAERCETLVVVGDPLQNLYEWRGSEPHLLEDDVPPGNVRVLSQSYRVPRAVHQFALQIADKIRDHRDFAYRPRDFEGEVRRIDSPLRPGRVEDILLDAERRYLDHGKTVMFLASCGYMLNCLVACLKERGIPFWNPFSRSNGAFNPLTPARGLGVGHRLLNYLRPREDVFGDESRMWTAHELLKWIEWIQIRSILVNGAYKQLKEQAASQQAHWPVEPDYVESLFRDHGEYESLAEGISTAWLLARVKDDKFKRLKYAVNIFEKHGRKAFEDDPKVIVGTIHSVKGGEGDVVYISPELSPKFFDTYEMSSTRDQITRMFYVAVTRAKETLVLCEQEGLCFEW